MMRPEAAHDRVPYPGLRSFEPDEAVLFFGRDTCVDDMVETLQRERCLAVLGASGSGKSSLVRTGLFEALRGGMAEIPGSRWTIADIRHPGGRPYRALAKALIETSGEPADDQAAADLAADLRRGPRRIVNWWNEGDRDPHDNLLILVDQFEEVFRYQTQRERDNVEAFVDLLLASLASEEAPIYVVLTMRSEYLGLCALIEGLAEQINRSLSLTPRMLYEECKAAIVGPSRIRGFEVDPRLVTTLLSDMDDLAPLHDQTGDTAIDPAEQLARRADQLPLMQHVLNRLWHWVSQGRPKQVPLDEVVSEEVVSEKVPAKEILPEEVVSEEVTSGKGATLGLTLEDYRILGGLNGALSDHANRLLKQTGNPALAERVFRALVEGTTTTSAVRRVRTLEELVEETGAEASAIGEVIKPFRADSAHFLQPPLREPLYEDTDLDISHESLIRRWDKLSDWLLQEAEDGRTWHSLIELEQNQRNTGLIANEMLAFYQDWWRKVEPTEHWAKRYGGRFREARAFLDTCETAEQAAQTKAKRSRRRNRQIAAAAVSAVAILAVSFPAAAYFYTREKQRQAVVALQVQQKAKAETERAGREVEKAKIVAKATTDAAAKALEQVKAEAAQAQHLAALKTQEAEVVRNQAAALQARSRDVAGIAANLLNESTRQAIQSAFRAGVSPRQAHQQLASARQAVETASAKSQGIGGEKFAESKARLDLADARLAFNELDDETAISASASAQHNATLVTDPQMRAALLIEAGLLQGDALTDAGNSEGKQRHAQALAIAAAMPLPRTNDGAALSVLAAKSRDAIDTAQSSGKAGTQAKIEACMSAWQAINWHDPKMSARSAIGCTLPYAAAGEPDKNPEFTPQYQAVRDAILEVMDNDLEVGWMFRDAALALAGDNGDLHQSFSNLVLKGETQGLGLSGRAPEPNKTQKPFESVYLRDIIALARLGPPKFDLSLLMGSDENYVRIEETGRYLEAASLRLGKSGEGQANAARSALVDRLATDAAALLTGTKTAESSPSATAAPGSPLGIKRLEVEARLIAALQAIAPGPLPSPLSDLAGRILTRAGEAALDTELSRYPFFLVARDPTERAGEQEAASGPEALRLPGYLAALCESDGPACTRAGLDPQAIYVKAMASKAAYEAQQARGKAPDPQQSTGPADVALDGIDPLQCIHDIEGGHNLATAETPVPNFDFAGARPRLAPASDAIDVVTDAMNASTQVRQDGTCVAVRGFGSYSRLHQGRLWLFASSANLAEFDRLIAEPRRTDGRLKMIEDATISYGDAFGRIMEGKLTFADSFSTLRLLAPPGDGAK